MELNELLATPVFSERNFTDVHQDLNIPVPDAVILNNSVINDADSVGDQQPTSKRPRSDPNAVSGSKVMYLPSGTVACNAPLCDMIKIVKPIIRKLVEDCKFYFFILNMFKICLLVLYLVLEIILFLRD